MSKDKQSIQVTIRVRPLSEKEKQEDSRICVDVEQPTHSINTFYGNQTKKFTFDSISNNNTQDDMFQKVGKRSTIYCLEGYNCTIFAYGQTGSGKTFTMMGVDPAHQQYDNLRGLIPRTLEYLFQSIDMQIRETESEYIIRCSFLEIYNEQIIDLLNPKNNSNLQIREDIKKGVYVEGISEETIFKGDEALDILKKGSKGRHVGSTCYNETSSRSHSVFTMQIESKHTNNGVVNTKVRHFHFIDLAGSQRTKQINGQRLKQGCSINKSLHVLGKVINSLAESTQTKPRHINYRDSKLTFLLKDSLGGNSKTHLIANISPCTMSYSETNMTLAFARRVKLIKVNKALINEDMTGNLEGLKGEIRRLKQEIVVLRNMGGSSGNGGMGNSRMVDGGMMMSNHQFIDSTNTQPLSTSSHPSDTTNMLTILNQYVSEQLDKQTKFQLQINRLNKKLDCLQHGIRKYSQNEIHMRMVLGVYEEKVKRMKKAEGLLEAKIDGLNGEEDDEERMKLLEYFRKEREELVKEAEGYKKLVEENSNSLLRLLKSCKAYASESCSRQFQTKQQQFTTLLRTNTQFLTSLQQHLTTLHPSHTSIQQPSIDLLIQQKLALVDLQYSKRQAELLQRVEQLQLEINEFKSLNEESEALLKQSVDREIELEEVVKQKERKVVQLQGVIDGWEEKAKEHAKEVQSKQKTIQQLIQQNTLIKHQLHQQTTHLQHLTLTTHHTQTLTLTLHQQITLLTQQTLQLQTKLTQTQNDLINSIKEYEEKVFYLEDRVKVSGEEVMRLEREVREGREMLKGKEREMEGMVSAHMKEVEEKAGVVMRLEQQLLKHQKEIVSITQAKTRLQDRLKTLQQKHTTASQQLQHTTHLSQQQSLTIIHLTHSLQSSSTKLAHLQSLLSQKNQQQLSLQEKFKSKEESLMQMITEMQTTSDSSHEEFNKIRIEAMYLRQQKAELEGRVVKLGEEVKQARGVNEEMVRKVEQLRVELEEKAKRVLAEKEDNIKRKEEVRSLTYQLQQAKSQLLKTHSTIAQKDEQFQQLHTRNLHLTQTLTLTKKHLNQSQHLTKESETRLFCLQKSTQIQKESLMKETQRRVNRLSESVNEKVAENKKLQKQVNELKGRISCLEGELQQVGEQSRESEKMWKEGLEKGLKGKQEEVAGLVQKLAVVEELCEGMKVSSQQQTTLHHQATTQLSQQITHLTLTNTQLTTTIHQHEQTISTLQSRTTSLQQTIEQLQQKHESELEELQFEHNEQIDGKNEEIERLNGEVERMNGVIVKRDEQLVRLNEEIRGKDEEIRGKDEELMRKEVMVKEKMNEIQEIKQQLTQTHQQLQATQQQLTQKHQQLQLTHQQLQHTQTQLTQTTTQLASLNTQLTSLNTQLQQLTTQLTQSQQYTSSLTSQVESLTEQLSSTQQEVRKRHEGEMRVLNSKVVELTEELVLVGEKLGRSQSTITNLQSALITKQQMLTQSQIESSDKHNDLLSKINQMDMELKQRDEKVVELRDLVERMKEERMVMEEQVDGYKLSLQQLTTSHTTLQHQHTHLQSHLLTLQQQLLHTTHSTQQKQLLISQLNQQLYLLQKSSSQINVTSAQMVKELSMLKVINQSKEGEIGQLRGSIKEISQEVETQKAGRLNMENKYDEVVRHNQRLEGKMEELSQQLGQINNSYEELTHHNTQLSQQLQTLKDQSYTQLVQTKQSHANTLTELHNTIKTQKSQIQSLQLLIQQKQTNLATLSHTQTQKEQLMESYKSLQQINKGLGRKCQELITSVQEQKTEYRKLQTKYLGEKNINENLKQLVENSQQQKRHLTMELKEKTEIYQRLVEKIGRSEVMHGEKEKKAEHYLKTVDLLQKSRHQQLQLRKTTQQLKRQLTLKHQSLQKRDFELKDLTKNHLTLQTKIKSFEKDYLSLQSKYQQLLENQKVYEHCVEENMILKQQVEESRPKVSRMTLKIEQLQERMRAVNQEYIELQNENHELKKKILYPGTTDQRASMYINKLKSQINDLKKEKLILEDTIKKETSERMRLKTEMLNRTGSGNGQHAVDTPPSSPYDSQAQHQQLRQQLEKRMTEIRYLQQIIAEMIDILKIKQFQQGTNPKSIKIESIRKGIVASIKEKIQENKYLKERIHSIEERLNAKDVKEKENKVVGGSSVVYNGVGSSGGKNPSSSSSTHKLQRRQKSFSTKQEQLSHFIRNKISSNISPNTSNQPQSQQKQHRQRKGIQMEGLRTLVDEQTVVSGKEKMKVREIVMNGGRTVGSGNK